MTEQFATFVEDRLRIPSELTTKITQRSAIGLAAALFVLLSTLVVAFDDIFTGADIAALRIGDVAPQNITAPDLQRASFVSAYLTQQARDEARNAVAPVYDPPDPNVAQQQAQLTSQVIDFIENVRRDPFGSPDQKLDDIHHIIALTLDDNVIRSVLQMDDETWVSVRDEITTVLPRLMREPIRTSQISALRNQLPTQVSVGFSSVERAVIVDIVEDLLRPNTFENPQETLIARQAAADAVADVQRSFSRGEVIVREGQQIDALVYEALSELGLLHQDNLQAQQVMQAFLASIMVTVIIGLYLVRFAPHLIYIEPRTLTLLAALFLVMLAASRFLGVDGAIYLFPTAALALLYVALIGPQIAIVNMLGLALLIGLMSNNSLEISTMVAASGLIAALGLRQPERLNSFFVAGGLVAVVNVAVMGTFKLVTPANDSELAADILLAVLNGVLLTPAAAIASMYIVTLLFNVPTALKLLDLSQPSKPLLQRLLRESPGTYQHSLQVANLAEQAAEAIGADATLTHVAALYHDIGKMLNPLYFTENQQNISNPHNALNDPYRSADIIISHVTEGDELARQYRLPNRIRDFIREHHGTTQVYVFYRQAIAAAGGDESAVDIGDFTYPGPRPRSRETALLMLADSCEAAVRSIQPESKQAISDVVNKIFEDKRQSGQLDESYLSLNDLRTARDIFVDILQSMFHPRINYQEAVKSVQVPRDANGPVNGVSKDLHRATEARSVRTLVSDRGQETSQPDDGAPRKSIAQAEDDTPLSEVPRLPRSDGRRSATDGESSTEGETPFTEGSTDA